MYSAGRQGATEACSSTAAGLAADERGRIAVDESYRTAVDHIYAVGDVIGFPALAATSMEQGRLAALRTPSASRPPRCERAAADRHLHDPRDQLRRAHRGASSPSAAIPYEVGISRYRELARGQIVGDSYGMLKLLVSPGDRHAARRARLRHRRDRADPHRPGGDGLRRHGRLPRRRGLQLPDAGRDLQGRRAGRVNKMRAVARLGIEDLSLVGAAADDAPAAGGTA